jgi:hypothetical protein
VFIPARYFIKQTPLTASEDGEEGQREDGEESSNEGDEEKKVLGTDIYSEDSDLVAGTLFTFFSHL